MGPPAIPGGRNGPWETILIESKQKYDVVEEESFLVTEDSVDVGGGHNDAVQIGSVDQRLDQRDGGGDNDAVQIGRKVQGLNQCDDGGELDTVQIGRKVQRLDQGDGGGGLDPRQITMYEVSSDDQVDKVQRLDMYDGVGGGCSAARGDDGQAQQLDHYDDRDGGGDAVRGGDGDGQVQQLQLVHTETRSKTMFLVEPKMNDKPIKRRRGRGRKIFW